MRKRRIWRKNKNTDKSKLSAISLLPNIISLTAICCGVTSLKFALSERWELAVISIFFAAFFDVIDGALARMLRATSEFGAQLDSLSDFMSFGIAPGFIIYLWNLKNFGFLGWGSVIIYILCIVIRLARFNSDITLNIQKYEWQKMFFKGVPSTIAAALLMLPIILDLSDFDIGKINSHFYIIFYIVLIGLLSVSTIPTFSIKKIKINKDSLSLVMLSLGFVTILLITYPWFTIPFFLIIYLFSIPVSIYKYRKLNEEEILIRNNSKIIFEQEKIIHECIKDS
jgi:CDP-diacylglycerol--serine O-phosphatidyltransferase